MALSSAGRTSAHRHILAALLVLCTPAVSSAQDISVTLLGPGAPPAEIDRFGPSTLVAAGGELLLFDVGPAAQARLAAELVRRTRATYAGAVEVGEDLMTIVVGDRVDVRRFTPRP